MPHTRQLKAHSKTCTDKYIHTYIHTYSAHASKHERSSGDRRSLVQFLDRAPPDDSDSASSISFKSTLARWSKKDSDVDKRISPSNNARSPQAQRRESFSSQVCMCVSLYVCMCVFGYVCKHLCLHVCILLYMYSYMSI